jgi:hypothetical protein
MDGRTPFYHDISINCSHLRTIFGKSAIIYASVNNLLGRDNIYGYRYYSQPNTMEFTKPFRSKTIAKGSFRGNIYHSIRLFEELKNITKQPSNRTVKQSKNNL